jgi:hypothetical protein
LYAARAPGDRLGGRGAQARRQRLDPNKGGVLGRQFGTHAGTLRLSRLAPFPIGSLFTLQFVESSGGISGLGCYGRCGLNGLWSFLFLLSDVYV